MPASSQLPHGLQVSSVCRRLAHAAADLLCRPGTVLDLTACKQLPSSLHSRLLASWAPHLSTLAIDEAALDTPGLARFLSLAARLAILDVECATPKASAKLSRLFHPSSCSSSTKLRYSGGHLPASLPPRLQHLEVNLGAMGRPVVAGAGPPWLPEPVPGLAAEPHS